MASVVVVVHMYAHDCAFQQGMLVFSMGDRSSFEHLDKWMKECMEYSQTNKLPLVLLGNKVSLSHDRVVNILELYHRVSFAVRRKEGRLGRGGAKMGTRAWNPVRNSASC